MLELRSWGCKLTNNTQKKLTILRTSFLGNYQTTSLKFSNRKPLYVVKYNSGQIVFKYNKIIDYNIKKKEY